MARRGLIALAMVAVLAAPMACSSSQEEVNDEEPVETAQETEEGSQDEVDEAPAFDPEELETFEDDEWMTGYRTPDGEVIIEAQYLMAMPFDEYGHANVRDEDGWALIDATGEVVVRVFEFDNGPDYFSEGKSRYIDGDKMGYINPKGEVVIEAQFDFATPFEDGRAEVCNGCEAESDGMHDRMVGGDWWAIDENGDKVEDLLPPEER